MNLIRKIIITCCVVTAGSALSAAVCLAGNIEDTEDDKIGGSVEAEINGQLVHFPALKTDVKVDIQGDLATIKIIQVFENTTDQPLNARYLFPMNKDAAVYAMTMEVGNEIIKAKIKRKKEAAETFEKAKAEGKAASLLTQHRPNMFTQKIANLMPNLPIKITLQYTQTVPKIDDAYELVVPLVVGPRYNPPMVNEMTKDIDPEALHDQLAYKELNDTDHQSFGVWELDKPIEYPFEIVDPAFPDTIDMERVSIDIDLNSDIPVQELYSATHALKIAGNDNHKDISLMEGRTIDNADFVLRYTLGGKDTQAGFLATRTDQGNFFSLMIEPPASPKDSQITSREMVFVLDTSGSMSGQPIEASKTFMQNAMKSLRPDDFFRIIRFSDNASEYASAPVHATPGNIKDGLKYINSLSTSGGTNIPMAISQAFAPKEQEGTLRIVVFLTDGYIGNEASVLKQIASTIGNARIYAFGVGSSVNRYLLAEMGRRGRGFTRFIDPTEDVHDAAISLAKKLNAPVLTDIDIDWDDMELFDITPDIIPDLFAGDSLRIQGRFKGKGTHTIRVNGKIQGHKATLPVQVTLPAANDNDNSNYEEDYAIALIWARSRIADLMRHIQTPFELRTPRVANDDLKEQVIKLGLDFSLMTKWTSFVAVSEKIVNKDPKDNKTTAVPLPKVKGVSQLAYSNNNFSGGSVPEPATTGGLIVLGGAAAAALKRRKRKRAKSL
jgi:Ca-activated chloride channel family protein